MTRAGPHPLREDPVKSSAFLGDTANTGRAESRRVLTAIVMTLSPLVPASAWARGVEEFLADVRVATARYRDIVKAREDGFVQISGMEALHGFHFMNINSQILYAASHLWSTEVDLAKPPMLLYVEREGLWRLVGVEYALPTRPAHNPFPDGEWHLAPTSSSTSTPVAFTWTGSTSNTPRSGSCPLPSGSLCSSCAGPRASAPSSPAPGLCSS